MPTMSGTKSTKEHAEAVEHDPYGHGHSVAAWVAVSVVMIGALIMSLAVVWPTLWLFVVGAVVALAGGPIGKILSVMGLGAQGRSTR